MIMKPLPDTTKEAQCHFKFDFKQLVNFHKFKLTLIKKLNTQALKHLHHI